MENIGNEMLGYDLIGDIHGHAEELSKLLQALGYRNEWGDFSHPDGRKVIFLGDYIDRGPRIRETLQIVRGMVDSGNALAILGNHELNAVRFHTLGSDGSPLREHTPGNVRQHQHTLDQMSDAAEWAEWLTWFSQLPLSLDFGNLRAVHACWDDRAILELNEVGPLTGSTLEAYSQKGTKRYQTISRIVNGPEALLPPGCEHMTSDGRTREEFRVKWWMDLRGKSCREAIFPEDPEIPDELPRELPLTSYDEDAPPTFFGHYAIQGSHPAPIRPNLACLDYGMGKDGFLCAYRWDGEQQLQAEKFVCAKGQNAVKATKQ